MLIGYTTGVYDLFHVGHLNLLKNAKGMCDYLVVGVTVDELVAYKGKHSMIPFEDRIEIVRSCKYVDAAVPQYDMDKLTACKKLGAKILFVGDDWYGTDKWKEYEKKFDAEGIKIVYFPYTKGISSTKITNALQQVRGWTDESTKKALHLKESENIKMIDKNYCMSSYLAFRYIEDSNKDFYKGMKHRTIPVIPDSEKTFVKTSDEIGESINLQMRQFDGKKKGVLLSGGMDSAIVASYMNGGEAYTFRFLGGDFQKEELSRAEYFAEYYNLNLHYVDITWDTVLQYVDACMKAKCAPVHSIEPQILQATYQAKNDGVEVMFVGESSDLVFGGMDKLLSKDWTVNEFMNRYIFTNPNDVLKNPVDMSYLFERYRSDGDKIDFLKFMDDVFSIESSSSYWNAFAIADMPYYDPYAHLKMAEPLDLKRVRSGESKYLIRELMAKRYPEIPVPNKNPMPRPVDSYFSDWKGPVRPEFKKNLDMSKFTGNQKWQMWCLEKWLNMNEGE